MSTITVKTQAEFDALPARFEQWTVIRIESAERIVIRGNRENSSAELCGSSSAVLYGSSRAELYESSSAVLYGSSSAVLWGSSSAVLYGSSSAELYGSSSAVLYGSSRAELHGSSSAELRGSSSAVLCGSSSAVLYGSSSAVLWGSSRADAFLCATLIIWSTGAAVNRLLDNAHAIYRVKGHSLPKEFSGSSKITIFEEIVTPTFEQWLARGYVVADGIHQKLVSQKTIGEVTIFEVTDLLEREKSFVAKKGDKFAHGKTIKEAKDDLRYKISDRDTSKFAGWKIDAVRTLDEMIEAYMTITGACSQGTKMFCDGKELKKEYTPREIIKLTEGQYGHDTFKGFGWAV